MRLTAKGNQEGSGEAWPVRGLQWDKRSSLAGRLNMAGVCALSRRLMAAERARVLGTRPLDMRAWALEQEAKSWLEGGFRKKGIRDNSHL